jgi:hypothetical protein
MAYVTGKSAANKRTLDQFHAASRGRAAAASAAGARREANASVAKAGEKAVKAAHAQQRKKKMSEEDKKKEKIRNRRIGLQKALSRTKDGKKVRDEKDIASGPKKAFRVKNKRKRNSLKIKDD